MQALRNSLVLFLALSGMAQTNNVVVRVVPNYLTVGELRMKDGRAYQAQEPTLVTNYIAVVVFKGKTNEYIQEQITGPTLTNLSDLHFEPVNRGPPPPPHAPR